MKYTFSESFGIGPKYGSFAEFEVELSDQEAEYLRAFLKENGEYCDYAALEYTNRELFNRINDAANDAVLDSINEKRAEAGEPPLEFDEVDWSSMVYDFYWPDELLGDS